MPTPIKHSSKSPSSAERWTHCTASIAATEHLPDKGSVYAREGTLAHEVCELFVRKHFNLLPYNADLEELRKHELWGEWMIEMAEIYRDFIIERSLHYTDVVVLLEQRVDYSNIASGGFGTSDCILIGRLVETGELGIEVIDAKAGKGVLVDAKENTQMRLYALGAINTLSMIYGSNIRTATMSIVQPRLNNLSVYSESVDDLNEWAREVIVPAAEAIDSGNVKFKCGDWCKFCKIKATCRERASYFTDSLGVMHKSAYELSAEELGYVLQKAKVFANYVSDVEEYCTDQLKAGESVPGYKLVEGRSVRKFTDVDKAFEVLKANGIPDAMLYERKPITLGATEKLIGKKQFAELLADYVIKPPGKPVMVADTDKRPAIDSAANDFKDFV